ncbi:hypothetical protein T01_13346 [Trichinella spiralis]|uniref:Uncharacterized protein n=1 Tax=Trichinella spiralis TaxID=6334 RepID=A0A0V1BDV2_TRISP|nr:hypothetical protein T01_13346 [Trichinella spiralis]
MSRDSFLIKEVCCVCSSSHNDGLSNSDLKQLEELGTDDQPALIASKEDIPLRKF